MKNSTTFIMPILFSLRKELEIECIKKLTQQIKLNNNPHNKFYVAGHKDNEEFINWNVTDDIIEKVYYNTKYSISEPINIVAKKCDTEYFCFIHPDVIVHDDNWIYKFQNTANVLHDVGILGIQNHSDFKDFSIKVYPTIYQVLCADAIMFFKSELFEEIGFFSMKYLADCESADFAYKALRAGYKNYWIDPTCIPAEHFLTPFRYKTTNTEELLVNAKNSAEIFWKKWKTFKESYINYYKNSLSK